MAVPPEQGRRGQHGTNSVAWARPPTSGVGVWRTCTKSACRLKRRVLTQAKGVYIRLGSTLEADQLLGGLQESRGRGGGQHKAGRQACVHCTGRQASSAARARRMPCLAHPWRPAGGAAAHRPVKSAAITGDVGVAQHLGPPDVCKGRQKEGGGSRKGERDDRRGLGGGKGGWGVLRGCRWVRPEGERNARVLKGALLPVHGPHVRERRRACVRERGAAGEEWEVRRRRSIGSPASLAWLVSDSRMLGDLQSKWMMLRECR